MTDFTQHHHWGVIEHDIKICLHTNRFTDESFWDFFTEEEILTSIVPIDKVNQFLAEGGGFILTDTPDPLPRFHNIELWALHPDPKWLTWISLVTTPIDNQVE